MYFLNGKRDSLQGKVPLLLTNHINYLSVDGVYIPFMKMRYPKSVFFIISNEFCERFSYYGMKTVLALYLTNSLKYDKTTSTVLYHVFSMLCYFFPLFGAIIADSFFGKFKTIFYLSIIYALGNIVLSFGAIPVLSIPHRAVSLIGLLFIAIGTGGIKPCVSSFGGDQFVLPEQSLQLQQFFSLFYFSINAGSMISTFLTPTLRNDVKCFGENSCFPLAFGVPAALMIVSVVIFLCGKNLYRMKQPEENIIVTFMCCIMRAVSNKFSGRNKGKKTHWLEYADDKYSKQQISDIRAVLNVLLLFVPVPLFWALFDQQGSRWTFQATNMDGRIFGYTLKPDQMQVINPLLILTFIPLFELYVYPLLKTIGVKRPLQKLVIGGWLAVLSFVISGLVELKVQDSYGVPAVSGEAQLRIFNSLNCNVTLNPSIENVSYIPPLSDAEFLHIPVRASKTYKLTFNVDNSCPLKLIGTEYELKVNEEKIVSYFLSEESGSLVVLQPNEVETLKKDDDGASQIRIFYSSDNSDTSHIKLQSANDAGRDPALSKKVKSNTLTDFELVPPGTYNLISNSTVVLKHLVLNPGEIDTILIHKTVTGVNARLINLVPSNKIHMLWQLPQIMTITAGEIMFSITGLEFSFTQAPPTMKSVLSAAWLFTVAFGNLIVVVVSESKIFDNQAAEFFLFAGLMAVDILVLIALCIRYKYVNFENHSDDDLPDIKRNGVDPVASRMTSMSTLDDF